MIVVGANGAGKSSLLGSMAGVLRHEGHWTVGGEPAARDDLGYAPQRVEWPGGTTVHGVCRASAFLRKVPKGDTDRAVASALAAAGLAEHQNDRVSSLSGGMSRRLTLAQALVHSPEVVLLDEPTSELDPGAADRFGGAIRELAESRRVIVTTHRLEDVGQWPGDVLWVTPTGSRLVRVGHDTDEGPAKAAAVRHLFRAAA
ncbi:ATP-binding cassette domain-containing protein [Kytococcus sedentarius]|nr:ATP-binding cassette domain-containing protein [Kytococcus sedentarius]